MGQYYSIMNMKTKTFIPRVGNEMAKLIEKMSHWPNRNSQVFYLVYLLATDWANSVPVVQGDYAQEGDFGFIPEETGETFKKHDLKPIPEDWELPRYLLIRRTEPALDCIIDTHEIPDLWSLLPALLANSNGRGGGDICFRDYVCLSTKEGNVVGAGLFRSHGKAMATDLLEKNSRRLLTANSLIATNDVPKEEKTLDITEEITIIFAYCFDWFLPEHLAKKYHKKMNGIKRFYEAAIKKELKEHS